MIGAKESVVQTLKSQKKSMEIVKGGLMKKKAKTDSFQSSINKILKKMEVQDKKILRIRKWWDKKMQEVDDAKVS